MHLLSDVDQQARTGSCSNCGPVEIRIKRRTNGTLRFTCREAERAWTRKTPQERREYRIKHLYKISVEEYDAIHDAQNGVCAICGRTSEGKKLAVDHCHSTGLVRGLLCTACNVGLGLFRDDLVLLAKAMQYLQNDERLTRVKE